MASSTPRLNRGPRASLDRWDEEIIEGHRGGLRSALDLGGRGRWEGPYFFFFVVGKFTSKGPEPQPEGGQSIQMAREFGRRRGGCCCRPSATLVARGAGHERNGHFLGSSLTIYCYHWSGIMFLHCFSHRLILGFPQVIGRYWEALGVLVSLYKEGRSQGRAIHLHPCHIHQ
jgi:hypothetical protein